MTSKLPDAPTVRFGHEEIYDFTSLDEFFEAPYAPEPCRAIHLGCGDGRTSVYIASRGFRLLGIDADRDLLGAARERASMSEVDIDLMAGDPRELPPLPEESFGLAIDLWTAAALPDGLGREAYLRKIFRLIRRDGVLIASAPPPRRKRRGRSDRPFAFAGPFVSDFTRAGFEVLFEGMRTAPPGGQRLMVHARKPI